MKAIVQEEYGNPDDLEVQDFEKPTVGDNDILVRVYAASIHIGDTYMIRGEPLMIRLAAGLSKPTNAVPGMDMAGLVEAVGKKVTDFQVGDEVFGVCNGAFAEFACSTQDNLAFKPKDLTFEQAAALPTSGCTALQAIRDHGKVEAAQKVLINGASGGVGTFAVQIAKSFGAEVTGVCSTRNVDLVRSIGADHVIDYSRDNFTQSGQQYDLIFDVAGSHSLTDYRRALTPEGKLIPIGGPVGLSRPLKMLVVSMFVRQQGRPFVSLPNQALLTSLTELCESGKVKPIIDKTYPLSEAPAAIAYVAEGHARAKVVISVISGENQV